MIRYLDPEAANRCLAANAQSLRMPVLGCSKRSDSWVYRV